MAINHFNQRPEDVSYVYSIYAPLSVRLTQLYNKLNWRSITDSVNDILPGKMRAEIQPVPAWLQKRGSYSLSNLCNECDRSIIKINTFR